MARRSSHCQCRRRFVSRQIGDFLRTNRPFVPRSRAESLSRALDLQSDSGNSNVDIGQRLFAHQSKIRRALYRDHVVDLRAVAAESRATRSGSPLPFRTVSTL